MKKLLAFSSISMLLALLILTACNGNKNSYPGYSTSNSGLIYKIHSTTDDARKPQMGDIMTLSLKYSKNDSLLFDTQRSPSPMMLPMKESDYPGEIYEGLAMLSVGDSASFMINSAKFFKITAQMNTLPSFADSLTMLRFDVKMLNIQTNEEFEADEAARGAELLKNETEVLTAYLKENKVSQKADENGLYYIQVEPGLGRKVKEGDWVRIHMKVDLIDGTPIFDTKGNDPIEYQVGNPFDTKGSDAGIKKMKVGEIAKLIVPSNIAFGPEGRGNIIPPYSTLLYEITLISAQTNKEHENVMKKQQAEKNKELAKNLKKSTNWLEKNAKKDGIITTQSGLQYKIIKEGEGVSPEVTDKVTVHYTGKLIDGTVFDSSVERGQPSSFRVNGVIAGWTEALQLMKKGAKWRLFIPPNLAYGERGAGKDIGPNEALIFDVELIDIEK